MRPSKSEVTPWTRIRWCHVVWQERMIKIICFFHYNVWKKKDFVCSKPFCCHIPSELSSAVWAKKGGEERASFVAQSNCLLVRESEIVTKLSPSSFRSRKPVKCTTNDFLCCCCCSQNTRNLSVSYYVLPPRTTIIFHRALQKAKGAAAWVN